MRKIVIILLLDALPIAIATVPSVGFGQDSTSATVTVYRPPRKYGAMIKPSIYCDGIELERLRNGRFFMASLPPGQHMISSGRSEVGQLVNLQAGKQYFFRFGWQRWVTGFVGIQPVTLTLVSEDKARTEMAGLKVNPK